MNTLNHSNYAQNNGPQNVDTASAQSMADLNRTHNCEAATSEISIHTGFIDLDRLISKLSPGSLIVISGRPEMEKFSFTLNIASHVVIEQQLPVVIFSMELTGQQVAAKVSDQLGKIDQVRLQAVNIDDDIYTKSNSLELNKLKGAKLFIDDTAPLNIEQLCSRIRVFYAQCGQLGLVIVNYLQLVDRADKESAKELMASLKNLAKDVNAPVIVISQIGRKLEHRSNKRPILSDFIEVDIEPEADLVLFIYRDEIYAENSPDKGVAEIIIGKNRCGPIGTVRLGFNDECCNFSNIQVLSEEVPNQKP